MKIALLGYGKMGKTIDQLVEKKFSRKHEITARANNSTDVSSYTLESSDVAIEFSKPGSAVANIEKCLTAGVPIVVGTTGWYGKLNYIKSLCAERNGTILYAANFSIGVQLFYRLNKQMHQIMNRHEDYGLTIEEIHHTEKKDSPSGTGIALAEDAIWHLDRYEKWENEESFDEKDFDERVLPLLSQRKSDVFGIHELKWKSSVDEISLKHEAKSRDGFAMGAIKAAEWVQGKKGVFTMDDFLKV